MISSHSEAQGVGSVKSKVAFVLLLILSFVSAAALTFINSAYLEDNYLYSNDVPTVILPILAFVIAFIALVGMLSVNKKSYSTSSLPEKGISSMYVVSLMLVAVYLVIFVMYVLYGAFDIGYGAPIKNNADLLEKLEMATLCYQIMIVLTPIAPIYFVLAGLKKKINAFFGSLTLLWVLAYILRLYFDVTDWVMSPRKLSMICATCFAALFTLYEVRFAFSRGNARKYFFVCALTASFEFSAGLAGVVSSIIGVYPSSFEIPYYMAALMIGVYAFIRLYSLAFASVKTEEPEEIEETEDNEGSNEAEESVESEGSES